MNRDDEIIQMHWNPKNHVRMSRENRSAQFAPFAALNGYKEAIGEVVRLVDSKIELTDDEKETINQKLLIIQENLKKEPHVLLTYFIKDKVKQGGKYVQEENTIKKIDVYQKNIVMMDNKKIMIDDILRLEILKS